MLIPRRVLLLTAFAALFTANTAFAATCAETAGASATGTTCVPLELWEAAPPPRAIWVAELSLLATAVAGAALVWSTLAVAVPTPPRVSAITLAPSARKRRLTD